MLFVDCSTGVAGLVDRMKVLLDGHPDLKHQFNKFLPTEYVLRDD